MKRVILTACLCSASAFLFAGCSADHDARNLIQPGEAFFNMGATGEQRVENGEISSHHQIAMDDQVMLDVWVVKPAEDVQAKATVVLLHDMGSSKASFPYPGTAARLKKMGYTTVLIDLRANGESGGKYVTHGYREKADVKRVVDNLISEGIISTPIYVTGIALGGVTAIQYAAIDERCKGVMVIYPYKDFPSLADWMMRLLPESRRAAALKTAGKLAKFDINDASSVEAVKKLTCPILIVTGLVDLAMPTEHAEAIYAAAPEPKELLKISRMALYATYEDWYTEQIDRLISTGLKKTEE